MSAPARGIHGPVTRGVGYPANVPRTAFLTPFAFPSVRGNAITAERIAAGLRQRGEDITTWDLSALPEAEVAAQVETGRPDLIHAFHALRSGPLGLRLARRLEIPLVVTLTGTDANHSLLEAEHAPTVRRVLEGAAVVTAVDASSAHHLAPVLPDLPTRLAAVPPGASRARAPSRSPARRAGRCRPTPYCSHCPPGSDRSKPRDVCWHRSIGS